MPGGGHLFRGQCAGRPAGVDRPEQGCRESSHSCSFQGSLKGSEVRQPQRRLNPPRQPETPVSRS